jgi:hypothetical protein
MLIIFSTSAVRRAAERPDRLHGTGELRLAG